MGILIHGRSSFKDEDFEKYGNILEEERKKEDLQERKIRKGLIIIFGRYYFCFHC